MGEQEWEMEPRFRGRRLWQSIERTGLLPAGVFFAVAWFFTPIGELAEFDPDEGVNLIKAMMHAHGYALYEQVWSDQPPLVTLLLAQAYEWAGPSLVTARLVTLSFATLLVWAVYQTLRLRVSVVAALVGVVLLVISRMYLRLSVSVMIGLPALALAMLAIYLLLRSRQARSEGTAVVLLTASGAALALSMQAKLFTAIVVLPMVLALMMPMGRGGGAGEAHGLNPWASGWDVWKAGVRRVAVWAAAVVGVFGVSALMLGAVAGDQLVGTHVAAQGRTWGDQLHDLYRLTGMVVRHAIYLPLAVAAVWWAWRRGVADVLLPAAWFVLAVVLLSVHRPLWYHHILLLTIPLAWLAGYGVQAWLEWDALRQRRVAVAAAVVVGLAMPLATPLHRQLHEETYDYRFALYDGVAAELAAEPMVGNPVPGYVFTDRPTYAYLSGRPLPPELAVQTSKRWEAGQITQQQVVEMIRQYRPRHVVLERYNDEQYGDALQAHLEQYYEPHRKVRHTRSHFPPLRHHVRRSSDEP
ncbi:glycosyltransferase family 39 protein [Phycisphaerales bacterium AB-hyl4]|uniref:Glycosyltransferase family 39 protein n=1 Tax=Natronomicrosphaera hydrolytica TaxID=3242702 RepID=A0ABV4U4H9_9BACT